MFRVLNPVAGFASESPVPKYVFEEYDVYAVTQTCSGGFTVKAFVPSLPFRRPAENQARLARARAKSRR